jgi:hypothetical protein
MCFSPEVSFGSAAILASSSAWCLREAARKARWFWPLAAVPGFFALQQASEGFVWIGLDRDDARVVESAARVYLFFAIAFWPTWFSVTAVLIEPSGIPRRFLGAWMVVSTLWFSAVYLPIGRHLTSSNVRVVHHSIRYETSDAGATSLKPLTVWGQRLLYAITSAVPLLVMSARKLTVIPVGSTVVTGAVAAYVYDAAFTSVWCLSAAAFSLALMHSAAIASRVGRSGQGRD